MEQGMWVFPRPVPCGLLPRELGLWVIPMVPRARCPWGSVWAVLLSQDVQGVGRVQLVFDSGLIRTHPSG